MNKKKYLCLMVIIFCMTVLTGCDSESQFPRVELVNTAWTFDTMVIPIGDGYVLRDYDKVVNADSTIDIIVHYDKVE